MKKITLIVQSKDVDDALKKLRRQGLLHVEHQDAPEGGDIVRLKEQYNSVSKAIKSLPDIESKSLSYANPGYLVQEILNLLDEKELLIENLKKLRSDIETWREWGDFDPELIDDLKDKNIWIQLCKFTKKDQRNAPDGIILEELFRKGDIIYCAAISGKEISLAFERLSLPEKSLSGMLLEEGENKGRISEIDRKLAESGKYKNSLFSYKRKLFSLIEFDRVRTGAGKFETLSYVRGYLPFYNVGVIEKLAEEERWGLLIEEPEEKDNAPTLIKNPRWIEIIKPVFKIIKTIPGYREVDISMWFLLFFSVFFGILIGDAGYGAVFFFINLLCHVKFGNKVRDKAIFFLMYALSFCAIAWGVLTGTFFGQAYLPKIVTPLLPVLRENSNIQALCFFIGALHLSVAHMWKFIRKLPSLSAFSEAGWVFVLWAAYFLAKSLVLGEGFPEPGKWLFAAGAALVILFTKPSRNIFKAVGSGAGNFLINIINSFTDIVSYIRLFAVGVATVAVADAFNQMAFGIRGNNIIAGVLTALVLLFGHTLNILLGGLAVLVHGVRLNVLEFSSHLNMEFSGVEYTPFREEGD